MKIVKWILGFICALLILALGLSLLWPNQARANKIEGYDQYETEKVKDLVTLCRYGSIQTAVDDFHFPIDDSGQTDFMFEDLDLARIGTNEAELRSYRIRYEIRRLSSALKRVWLNKVADRRSSVLWIEFELKRCKLEPADLGTSWDELNRLVP